MRRERRSIEEGRAITVHLAQGVKTCGPEGDLASNPMLCH